MTPVLSAIVCTHNPREDHLAATLASLRAQLPLPDNAPWELILLDNASSRHLESEIELTWHPLGRVMREDRLGLTHARLRSFNEARGQILVYIDDDNILDPSYLREAFQAMEADCTLGVAGGKSIPRYDVKPPAWFFELGIDLACRDHGNNPLYASWNSEDTSARTYPKCAPIGAGMVIRREAYAAYVAAAACDPGRLSLGRKGNDLSSGEDNDMVMSLLTQGWHVAYLPQLKLEHLIPARRLTRAYLANYAFSSSRTWVQVLSMHGIRPWTPISRWSLPLRKARAYLRNRAWASDANYVRWKGACGTIAGRQAINQPRMTDPARP